MWYTASMFFRSEIQGQKPADTLWEERIILIQADTDENALLKAKAIGKSSEHSYENADHEKVVWEYTAVERVQKIEGELIDGTELFSRFLSDSEATSLQKKL